MGSSSCSATTGTAACVKSSSAGSSISFHSWINVVNGCVCCSVPGLKLQLVLTHCALPSMARPLCLPPSIGVASERVPRTHLKAHQLAAVQRPPHLAVTTSSYRVSHDHVVLSQQFLHSLRERCRVNGRSSVTQDEIGTRSTTVNRNGFLE